LCEPQTLIFSSSHIHTVSSRRFFLFFFLSGLHLSLRQNTVFNLASFTLPISRSAHTFVFHFLRSFSFM
jgi:hypothetical protein